ncbi:MAG TPA: Crp/Fnr family transcriptional regulator [Cytophagales bacterium]|nr:Crp/Fnr family transcriptional regulator [Cytophagales bacterium]HAA19310.1 Crp/Fnr family transcriptional regulator [Cytophagales bacterium]
MHSLVQYLRQSLPSLSEEAESIVVSTFRKQTKKKGDRLVVQGEVCKYLYFLTRGISRSYSLREAADITTWFSFANDFITSFTSFFPREPSYEHIEMLTDGDVFQISYDQLLEIRSNSLEIERVINHFSLLYTIQLEKRLFLIQTYNAAEKYEQILEREPHLIQKIPSKYLASYLGITRETLSRIRSRLN